MRLSRCGVTTFCAPPTVWRMLIQEDLAAWKVGLREVVGAGEPLNPEIIEQVRAAWGLIIRDGYGQTETTLQIGNFPGQRGQARSNGAGRRRGIASSCSTPTARSSEEARNLPRARPAAARADAGLSGRRRRDRSRSPAMPTAPATWRCATPTAISPMSAAPTTCSKPPITGSARSSSKASLIEHPAVAEAAVVPSPDPLRLAVPKAFVSLGREPSARPRHGTVDLPPPARPSGALQARPPPRIRRSAENHLRARSAASNCAPPKPPAGAKTAASRANSGKKISPNSDEGWTRRLSRGTL